MISDTKNLYLQMKGINIKNVPTIQLYSAGIFLSALFLQVVSGILLLFYYKPLMEEAHYSLQFLSFNIPFGLTIRSVHYWTSNVLIISMASYLLHNIFSRTYKYESKLKWLTGILLFLCLLLISFSGLILPWDDRSFFSLTIVSSELRELPIIGSFVSELIKGSGRIGQDALSRSFAFHTGVYPFIILFLLLIHTITFLKNRNIKVDSDSSLFEHFIRIIIYSLLLLALIIMVSVFFPKFSGNSFDVLNPVSAPENIKPEWYFLFIYQLLKFGNIIPKSIIFLFILIFLIMTISLPWLDNNSDKKSILVKYITFSFLLFIIILTILGYVS